MTTVTALMPLQLRHALDDRFQQEIRAKGEEHAKDEEKTYRQGEVVSTS